MSDFAPALSVSEAEVRMNGLAGGVVVKTRGPKRALRSLAHALEVDVPVHLTNGTLGALLADALGIAWPRRAATQSDQVTLAGLNALLEAADDYFRSHPLPRSSVLPQQFTGPLWEWFTPARSKLEAVNRISSLTRSGPEELGPGGKERKSVLTNLVVGADLHVDRTLSKVDLGQAVADALGVVWTDTCGSTGYTITLEGLNVVLGGAERLCRDRYGHRTDAPDVEAQQLLGILHGEFAGDTWDARTAVVQMRDDGYRQWRQTEWPGWYFEYRGLRALHDALGPRPTDGPSQTHGSTTFDYAYRYVWDLKTHTDASLWIPSGKRTPGRPAAPLNDRAAVDVCAADTGIGFVVLGGEATFDETGEFYTWHRETTRPAKGHLPVRSNANWSRARKMRFRPNVLTAYRFDDTRAVSAAILGGGLSVMSQGRQARIGDETEGAPRPPKYALNLEKAVEWECSSMYLN
ncbi:hypothetical protein ACNI3K_00425 [Demequina sp. SO4-13]|uniref:hypothetical protein n=1 Tax=Demequina sp. SO4-13 TaxID=3401027 RepID=UPI003AF90EF6